MLPSSSELHYFLEVCQTLNLSRASERLGITQPSLSSAVKRLEKTIGTHLFLRTKNGVKLTIAGKQLYAHVKQLIHMWETVKTESLASYHNVQGQFVIGCHPTVAQYALPSLLAQLLNQYPHLEITLKHDLSRKIVEGIVNFSIDIGIVVNPIKHRDLIFGKLYNDVVGFWKPRDKYFILEHQAPIIVCDIELIQTQKLLNDLELTGINDYRLLTSSNLDVIASLTAAGCGLGILPGSVVHAHHNHLLCPVANMPVFYDEIYIAYRAEQRQVKALQTLIQAIRASFKTQHNVQVAT